MRLCVQHSVLCAGFLCLSMLLSDVCGGLGGRRRREQQNFRFALLSRAALEAVWHLTPGGVNYGDHNTVFVANDWQTALLPVYLQAYYRDHGKMLGSRSMLVMHNIAHQVQWQRAQGGRARARCNELPTVFGRATIAPIVFVFAN